MIQRRIMMLVLVALAVPFPALALSGGGEGAQAQTLSVSASLDQCGLVDTQIVCKIDAGWNSIDGAEEYAISVTSADGSVSDYGRTGGQGSSVWIPYSGPGSYSVTVVAYGTPPGEEDGKQQVLAKSSSLSGELDTGARTAPDTGTIAPGEVPDVAPTEQGGTEPPPVELPGTPQTETPPPCVEEPEPAETAPAPAPGTDAESSTGTPPDAGTIPEDDDCTG